MVNDKSQKQIKNALQESELGKVSEPCYTFEGLSYSSIILHINTFQANLFHQTLHAKSQKPQRPNNVVRHDLHTPHSFYTMYH